MSDNPVRNDQIKRHMQIRNAIIEIITKAGEPVTTPEFMSNWRIQQLNVKDMAALNNYLVNMRKEKTLSRIRVQRPAYPSVRFGYELYNPSIATTPAPTPAPSPVAQTAMPPAIDEAPPAPPAAPALPPDVAIDFVRDTGKLRIAFRGISIEIGVIQ